MPVNAKGVLTDAMIEQLKQESESGINTDQDWANLGPFAVKTALGIDATTANKILCEINSQIVRSATAWYVIPRQGGEWKQCPYPEVLIAMFVPGRIRMYSFTDPKEFTLEKLEAEYGNVDFEKKVAVVNWCRRFKSGKNGVFVDIETNLNVDGVITDGDYHGPSTSNAGTTRPTSPTPPKIVPPTPPSGTGKTINIRGDLAGRSKNGKKTGSGGVNIGSDGVPRDGDGNPIDLD